jgi:hypothetical protein
VIRRSTFHYVLAALLVPLALMVGLRSAWALYACRIDGVVRTSCCCHGKHDEHKKKQQQPSKDPSLKAASCCDVTVQAPSSAPQIRDAQRASNQAPPMAVSFVETPMPVAPIARAVGTDRPTGRPPPVATFLIKQSFLR